MQNWRQKIFSLLLTNHLMIQTLPLLSSQSVEIDYWKLKIKEHFPLIANIKINPANLTEEFTQYKYTQISKQEQAASPNNEEELMTGQRI